jgi:hypothetical protein
MVKAIGLHEYTCGILAVGEPVNAKVPLLVYV